MNMEVTKRLSVVKDLRTVTLRRLTNVTVSQTVLVKKMKMTALIKAQVRIFLFYYFNCVVFTYS